MGYAIEVKAGASLQRKIDALMAEHAAMPRLVSMVVRDSAMSVIAKAKEYVPISTGALRRSLNATFSADGLGAIIGSWLPYARRQEYDDTLDHSMRPTKRRIISTKSGKVGSIIKGTQQTNPKARVGFLRSALFEERPHFLAHLQALVDRVGEAWGR
jgi:hypothetical protein